MRLSFVLYFSSTNNFFTFSLLLRSSWEASSTRSDFRTELLFLSPIFSEMFFPPISVQFRTFPYRVVFFNIFSYNLPFCGNVRKLCGNVRKYRSNSFREFRRIPQKRFPYNFAEFYGNFLRRVEVGWHLKDTYNKFYLIIVHLMIKFCMKRNIVSHIFNFNLPQDMAL